MQSTPHAASAPQASAALVAPRLRPVRSRGRHDATRVGIDRRLAGSPPEDDQPAPMAPGDEAPEGTPGSGETVCPDCGGSGKGRSGAACPTCQGSGVINVGIGGG